MDIHIYIVAVTTTATASVCSKCGILKKSGTASCCAPGGAWFENCGAAGDRNVDHKWSEGVKACKGKSTFKDMLIQPCSD